MSVAALILGTTTVLFTPLALKDILPFFAVMASWGHMSVATRLAEAQAAGNPTPVDCVAMLRIYLWVKEALWAATFLTSKLYAPLVGSLLFSLYPVWRGVWRTHKRRAAS